MENFRFCNGTDIRFGKDTLGDLPELLRPYGRRVLLTYGGGSVKRTGLYDQVTALLKDFEVFELSGIEPNPRVTSVYAGSALCREKGVDVILAVGGGSTIDCSKAIAAAALCDEDAWKLVKDASKIKRALPLVVVLTLAATGSETNCGGVISNLSTNEKLGFINPCVRPKAAILDPRLTFTVSARQTAAGAADIFSHVVEQYFAKTPAFVSDRICEGLLKAVIRYAPEALRQPDDYEARAQLMWAGTLALNNLCALGKRTAWSCHPIEHEVSAYHDITHGVGLAILTPHWMRYALCERTLDAFAAYARNVWGLEDGGDRRATAEKSIDLTAAFFASLGIPATLGEAGVGSEHFAQMARHAVACNDLQNAFVPLDETAVEGILRASL